MKNCPDLATIISYSSGALSKSFALLVSSHIEKCGHCKKISIGVMKWAEVSEETEHTDLATNSYALFLEKLEASKNKETQTSKKDIFDKSSEVLSPAKVYRERSEHPEVVVLSTGDKKMLCKNR